MAISNNFRPVQATNERSILDVETSTKMFNPAFADWQNRPFDKVKFIYSEKATKSGEISTVDLTGII